MQGSGERDEDLALALKWFAAVQDHPIVYQQKVAGLPTHGYLAHSERLGDFLHVGVRDGGSVTEQCAIAEMAPPSIEVRHVGDGRGVLAPDVRLIEPRVPSVAIEDDRVFDGTGLCLRSYAAAVTGRPASEISPSSLPSEWFGDVPHTHRAIDDALGYANLLVTLGRMSQSAGHDA